MKFITTNRAIVLSAMVIALALISGGSAQVGVPDVSRVDTMDLSARVPEDDLDSYWSDTNTWSYYGYRPHVQTHQTRFMGSLPSYFSGASDYSFGMNPPRYDVPSYQSNPVQMTASETWH